MCRFAVIASLLCACGAQVDGGAPANPEVDGGGGGGDTGVVDTDPTPACFNGRVVYLNFDGVTLTKGTSDATQNTASWMQIATGTAPRYETNNANRDQKITQITDGVTSLLMSFPITVVTTRPNAGPYVMIVFGGNAQQVGSRFGVGVQQLDCDDATSKSDLAWITDGQGVQRTVNTAVGAIGFGLGLTATSDPGDCMCGWDNGCQPDNTQPCTLSPAIARDPAARQLCPGVSSQDEVATFKKAFCE